MLEMFHVVVACVPIKTKRAFVSLANDCAVAWSAMIVPTGAAGYAVQQQSTLEQLLLVSTRT